MATNGATTETIVPNLFVIGAPKAGTTALVSALGKHPDIYVPGVKEIRYFDAEVYYDSSRDYPVNSYDEYLGFFRDKGASDASYRVDGSIYCMYDSCALRSILRLFPKARFILMLRDPVEAARSMHAQRLKYSHRRMREISEDFCTCWRSLPERRRGRGLPRGCRNSFLFRYDLLYSYERWLPEVFKLIPARQLHIERYESFRADPGRVFGRIFSFLGLDQSFDPGSEIVNPSYLVEPNLRASLLGNLARSTFWIRKALGLRGDRVAFARRWMRGHTLPRHRDAIPCEPEVAEYFARTYTYLARLEGKGSIPPIEEPSHSKADGSLRQS